MPVEPPIETPRTLADAFALLATSTPDDQLTPIAGGTDVMVRISGEIGDPPGRLVELGRLDELRGIQADGEAITIGALTTYTEIRRSAPCREHLPALVDAAATIGAAQIQNRGTLGGNIANASPAGDTLPVFAVADADVVLAGEGGERRVPFNAFYTGYRKSVRRPDELIVAVEVPPVTGKQWFRKVGTRAAQAISKVVFAGVRGPVTKLALGSVAPTVVRLPNTEMVLNGGGSIDDALDAMAGEITPIDDLRSTAQYRRTVASNLVRQFWSETA